MLELLAQARKVGEQAEVFQSKGEKHSVVFQASKLKEITSTEEQSTTLRLIQNGLLGSASVTKPDSSDVLLKYAANTVKYGSPVKHSFPTQAQVLQPRVTDERVRRVTQQEMLDIAGDLVAGLNAFDPSIKAMAETTKASGYFGLANSNGFAAESEYTAWSVVFGGELVSARDGFLFIYDALSGTDFTADVSLLKARVIEAFRLAQNTASIRAGQYPVIFAPGEVSCLVNPLVACLNGKAVARGFSPFKGRLGELAFDPRLSIIDDATIAGALGSKGFDREGIPSTKRSLISGGKIAGYMLDLQTAAELNMSPTGNGSVSGPVQNNIIVPGGTASFSEMLAGIDEGVLIEGTMGAWAGNPYGGQVSGNISLGYKIEKGQIVGRIKDAMFSLNVFTDLRDNLASISSEQLWRGNACFPYLQLRNVNISTKG